MLLATVAACGLVLRPVAPRAHCVMGGFENQQYRPAEGHSRVSFRVSGSSDAVANLPDALRSRAVDGLTGVMYNINDERLEAIVEGERALLEPMVEYLEEEVTKDGAECRLSWQLPGGGYDKSFPLVQLSSDMQATISLRGEEPTMAYYNRHLQVEAVFNRGLKIKWKKLGDQQLAMGVTGNAERLKSFVRWCYNGPLLERAEKVTIEWGKI